MNEHTEYTVTSEIYAEKNYTTNVKPLLDKKNVVSSFTFKMPPEPSKTDQDGDLIIERKNDMIRTGIIEIEHSNETILDLVGLQVWRGALLLADWLIHNNELCGHGKVLELGSGVGLTSIIAAMYTPVICTDINKGGILELISNNIKRNSKYVVHPIIVKELNFTLPLSKDILSDLPHVKILLAADVIYDDTVTAAFIDTLRKIFNECSKLNAYIALEKRYVFTIDDLNSVAPCYEYFLQCLEKLRVNNIKFEQVDLNFPKYFEYDRIKQLVLWKIYK